MIYLMCITKYISQKLIHHTPDHHRNNFHSVLVLMALMSTQHSAGKHSWNSKERKTHILKNQKLGINCKKQNRPFFILLHIG